MTLTHKQRGTKKKKSPSTTDNTLKLEITTTTESATASTSTVTTKNNHRRTVAGRLAEQGGSLFFKPESFPSNTFQFRSCCLF